MDCIEVDIPSNLYDLIALWLDIDQNEETRLEMIQLVNSKQWDKLSEQLTPRIKFGTAGLRSRMEAGFNRINMVTVMQASQGLSVYIKSQFPDNLKVVIGHDHRFNSRCFAEITATAFLNQGFTVYYLNGNSSEEVYVHTPLVPFSIDRVGAAVGVMITASHNPQMDNGYKVYYSNGSQIIPPHDKLISMYIDKNLTPWTNAWNYKATVNNAYKNGKLLNIKNIMESFYISTIQNKLIYTNIMHTETPWFVYTPMHGVGLEIFQKVALKTLSLDIYKDYIPVSEQETPNPSFPTLNFPNPEEKGALDLAIETADSRGISLVIANDPDADRFSVAIKNHHEWRQLNGNEIGFLFAYTQYQMYLNKKDKSKKLAMINSTVSSQMIKKMSELEKFYYEDTLTGFKWIGNRARELEFQGYFVPFGYEEAIGYMFPQLVHDKDGIAAAVVFLQCYYEWFKNDGKTPLDILESCYQKYGYFKEFNGYYLVSDLTSIAKVFNYVRGNYIAPGKSYPEKIGTKFVIETFRDLTNGYQSDTPDHKPLLPIDPSCQMITCTMNPIDQDNNIIKYERIRFTMRNSGTEPKLKLYIESSAQTEERSLFLSKLTWDVLKHEWIKPEINGLKTPF